MIFIFKYTLAKNVYCFRYIFRYLYKEVQAEQIHMPKSWIVHQMVICCNLMVNFTCPICTVIIVIISADPLSSEHYRDLAGHRGESYFLSTNNYDEMSREGQLVGYQMNGGVYTYRLENKDSGQILLHCVDFDLHPNSTFKV